jgi:hypothetical protein
MSNLKLSEQFERYRLILKQLGLCHAALYDFGFVSDRDKDRIEDFVTIERFRVDRALKACGNFVNGDTPGPTGIPSLDAAKKVAAAAGAR